MFKDKLKFLRKHQELSQAQVAKKLNILQTTYSHYEQGLNEPNFDTLKKLANFFNVTTDYLLENDKQFDDTDEIVDFNNFILNGKYTIHSKFLSKKERKRLNNVINAMYEDK